ncbi:MAG: hypothetical protein KQI35_08430 [Bacteroidetes bacterium]|nr:hypothetical protein [Bacteroidota bacterium]
MPKHLIINIGLPLFIVLFPIFSQAGSGVQIPSGGRGNALGDASVALHDFWSLHNNQAGLAAYNSPAASFYFQNRFLVSELGLKSGGIVLPVGSGVFGLSYGYFGYNQYNESKVGLAYSKTLGKGFSAGVQLDYITHKLTGDYGKASLFTFEIGMQKKISEKVVIGAHAFNPIRAKIMDEPEERISAIYRLGISYNISNVLVLVVETEKDLNYKPLLRTGLEYQVAQRAFARVGYASVPALSGAENLSVSSLYTFGFGLEMGPLAIDFSAAIHQALGWSPSVSMIYRLHKST